MEGKQNVLNFKDTLAQQWYLTKLCFRAAPGYMALHVFEAVKLQVSIFFEFTLCMNYILEVAEAKGPWENILRCMVLLLAGIGVSTVSMSVYVHSVKPKMKPMLYQAFRMKIYESACKIDLSCYDDTDFYQKFILATEESDACIDRYLDSLYLYCGKSVRFLLVTVYCFFLNPLVMLVPLLTLPLELWMVGKENKERIRARMERLPFEQKREYQSRVFYLSDYARELRQNPEMQVKCCGDFQNSNDRIQEINLRYGKRIFVYGALRDILGNCIFSYGLRLSLLFYQAIVLHSISLAHLLTSYHASKKSSDSGTELIQAWKSVAENSAYVASIREMISMKPTIVSRDKQPVPKSTAEVKVEKLTFSYIPGRPVLNEVSLCIHPGQKIALVGYNGSGKTTLVKLLLRLYEPVSGCIRMGGTDIRDFDIEQYRCAVGSVFQDFKIYAATLKENVLMDVSDGSREEAYAVELALHEAGFGLNDKRLVYQVETPLTTEFEEDGVNLSGGEAQKVAIARVLYRRQNLIIMDEPSSALDPLSEYLLNQKLNEIAKEKTVVFISHRLSTTRDADYIYMMEKGHIIEEGTHQELLDMDGKYARMWRIQAELYQNG